MVSIEPIDLKSTRFRPINGLFARVYADIQRDSTCLPSMPDLALRLRAAMAEPACSAATIARVVKVDSGVSAYLLRVANSALYGGVTRIVGIESAISRLGMAATRNLVSAHALRAMFTTRSRALESVMRDTWRRSAHVGAVSAVLAARCGFQADRALLAGLLQDIGALPLLHALEQHKVNIDDDQRVAATIDEFAPKVGAVLLAHWGFDDELIEVARSRGDWWRSHGNTADLSDLVLIARLHALVGTEHHATLPLINEVPAFFRLPLGELGPEASFALLREARDEIKEVLTVLEA